MTPTRFRVSPLLATAATATVVVWAYWTTLTDIAERWATDPQYSHGFLVPLFAGYLLWTRRRALAPGDIWPRWWGVGVVLAGAGLRLAAHFFYQPWLDS